jgi:hypothetical protein
MMNRNLKYLCLATLASLGMSLAAQDAAGPEYFFKMRAQAGATATSNLRNGIGFGAGANHKMAGGQLSWEVGYTYVPGNIFRNDIPVNTLGNTQANSVITEKHSADQLGVRVAYGTELGGDWSWHVGGGLYHTKARMETVGDLEHGARIVDGAWTTTTEKSTFSIQPFIGANYKLSESGSLEFNLIASTFKTPTVTATYVNTAADYNRALPVFGDRSVTNLKLEITYVFHF